MPRKIKCLLIAESPPEDYRNYFYYTGDERGNYCFFQNIILATLNIKYEQEIHDKRKILNMFVGKGFYLIDVVEYQINSQDNEKRKEVLIQNKFYLKEMLKEFNKDGFVYPRTKIVLVKNLVCNLFKDFLEADIELVYDREIGRYCQMLWIRNFTYPPEHNYATASSTSSPSTNFLFSRTRSIN